MKNLLSIFLLSSLTLNLNSQVNLDSLKAVWNDDSQPDTSRLNAMNIIAWDGYLFTQPDSAFYFAQLQYNFAQKKGIKKQMANALNTQGGSHYIRSNYESAIDYYIQSIEIKEEIGDQQGAAASLNNIGNIYNKQGNYSKAIDYFTKSLKIKEEIGDKKGIASSLNNIGIIYQEQGNYAEAIVCFSKSLTIQEELENQMGMAATLNNIGIVYKEQGDFVKAIEYYNRSLDITKEIGDQRGIALAYNNLGNVYHEKGDYFNAHEFYIMGMNIMEELNDMDGVASLINNIGVLYYEQDECDTAIVYYLQALTIQEEIGDQSGIANSLNNLGICYLEQNEINKAIDYGQRALVTAKKMDITLEIKYASNTLYEAYKSKEKYKQSLEMYELFIRARDSLNSEINQKEVIRQQFKYDYDKQSLADSLAFASEQEKSDLVMKEQEARLDQEKAQKIGFGIGAALALVLGLVAVFAFVNKRKDNRLIRSQKEEVESQKAEADHQRELVEEKNKEITDSITYAKRIQEAILPPDRLVKKYLPNSFVLYKPKDIVAGDFYWLETIDDDVFVAAADCTGHGVPGAMVSVVCHNALNRSVREFGLKEPGLILDKTRELVIRTFEKSIEDVKDGMDVALVSLSYGLRSESKNERESEKSVDNKSNFSCQLKYAGANNPLWIIRNGEIIETKANKQAIGKVDNPQLFTPHTIPLQPNDSIYIFSDGYVDQFGGDKGKKYKSKAFRELLLSIQDKSMDEQYYLINDAFETWRSGFEQVDDVCVIGMRVIS